MKLLKYLAFGSYALITVALMAATIVEKLYGSTTAGADIYYAPWMIVLWIIATACSLIYIISRRRGMSVAALSLHASFAVILIGAAITHFTALQGSISLALDEPESRFALDSGGESNLPFTITLDSCYVEYHPGTFAASDYVSVVTIHDAADTVSARISMNRILDYRNYRFYQAAMGRDYSVLKIAHDPWGIGVTYAGYILLGFSMIAFFFSLKSRFRSLVSRSAATALLLFFVTSAASAETVAPPTIPAPLAKNFGKLYVYSGNRIMPLQTMARDFCQKVYGDVTYKGLSAEQVVAGWLFYYDDWKKTPFIRIKGKDIANLIHNESRHASLIEFYSSEGYKLQHALAEDINNRPLHEIDERIGLVTTVCTGSAFKVFPIKDASGRGFNWLSPADKVPASANQDDFIFITTAFDDLAREIQTRQWKNADDILSAIRSYQVRSVTEGGLPEGLALKAEFLYNRVGSPLPPAAAAIVIGFAAFLLLFRIKSRMLRLAVNICNLLLLLWITALITFRWIIGGHFPVSNGYETMLAMAWIAFAIGSAVGCTSLWRKFGIIVGPAILTGGLALMVAYIGRDGASVSHLMPVLASPLLSVHVLLVMCSYALFAVIMLNSVTGIFVRKNKAECRGLAEIGSIMLYPAVFLLAAGIFVGAVWANQSWGRYWGWDSKETWALITMLIYALPLHAGSWNWFKRPLHVHVYLVLAFLSVLMTYFGVNYLLSGLHSYA